MPNDQIIYLDYNATTPLLAEAQEAMRRCERDCFGNASSRHAAGRRAWETVEQARAQVAQWAGAHADDVIFTSGATESNHLAILGRAEALVEQGRKAHSIRAAVSPVEHPCVKAAFNRLRSTGCRVEIIPVDVMGRVIADFFDDQKDFDIVSVMAANHETGVIQPIADIAALLDQERTFFHCDAAQWAGRFDGGLIDRGVSAVSLSAHKIYGPKGIGALLLRPGVEIKAQFMGAQEAGLRGGTVNTSGAVGFGTATEWMTAHQQEDRVKLSELKERLWTALSMAEIPIERTIPPEISLCNTLHLRTPGLRGERVVDGLDRAGVCCSSGPACASGASEPSPVLKAMGWDDEACWEGVRISLGHGLSEPDIDEAARRIVEWFKLNRVSIR
ncbi:MAG: aminotransferase class V-fold PLP-dependent enzyme [bacterium]|nr:aminotransferase class V-fold PLP-dependent enzyme [bacterium]